MIAWFLVVSPYIQATYTSPFLLEVHHVAHSRL
jgi:hypothetical protein